MGSVTPTVVPGEGYVRVEINWQDFTHTRRFWAYRTVAGVDTLLRDGDYGWLSNGLALCFDHEAPLDTPITYKSAIPLNYNGDFEAGVTEWQSTTNNGTVGTVTQNASYYVPGTGNASAQLTPDGTSAVNKAVSELIPITLDALNANPTFEVNAANWTAANGATISRDTTTFYAGVASGQIVPDGVTSTPQVTSDEVAVTVGRTYYWFAQLRVAAAGSGSRNFGIRWYNSSHVSLGADSLTTLTPTPGTWTAFAGSAVAPAGAAFARLISQGTGVLAAANSWRIDQATLVDPTLQTPYTLSGYLLLPGYWSGGVGVQLQWYSGTTLLGTSGALSDTSPFPGVWNPYSLSAVSVAGSDGVRAVWGIQGTPATTNVILADELYLTLPSTTVTSGPVVVPSGGAGWWTDPLHPATKVRLQVDLYILPQGSAGVAYLGVGEETFPADSVALEVNDAVLPIGTFQRRKGGRQAMQVGTATLTDLAQVKALHASGAPLFLQVNQRYGEADSYQLHGDLQVGRVNGDQRAEIRLVGSQFVKVAAPVGPAEGTYRTRYVDLNRYTTFAAATTAGVTWLDALRGNLAT